MTTFNHLPFEIRARIWELTVEPRTVDVRVVHWNGGHNWRLVSTTPVPAPLQVCHEARNMGLYKQAFSELGTEKRYVWLNFDIDLISIGKSAFSRFETVAPLITRLKFQRENSNEYWYHWESREISNFVNAKEVHINIDKAKLWGVYGDDVGCWFIQPSQEYVNSDQLKQERMVHMEAQTGDTALLNMLGGGHYQIGVDRTFDKGRMWGPLDDAEERLEEENSAWPYAFPNADISAEYQSRAGSVTGLIKTPDDRVVTQSYCGYYYRTTTDENGKFTFDNVRTGEYGLFAWPGEGSPVGDITTNFTQFDIEITEKDEIDLGTYTWEAQNRTKIWQIDTLDRLSCEFSGGCGPYGHALTDDAPGDLTLTIGISETEDWHYVLSNESEWTINFELDAEPGEDASARLTVSLAAYAARCYVDVTANDVVIGHIQSMESDSALYRSSTVAGVWRFLEYTIEPGTLKKGSNSIKFTTTVTEEWKSAMWDTILLK
ncbi:hypothetical protein VE03_06650 [Pseudogymnoascus sp. 23342-1-I1]|nr:hypothetical protein VE03_06650 [Pseudogymnoascus sp. 23342-1-I1]